MDTKQLLKEFSVRDGVSGREKEAAEYGAELLRAYGEVEITPLGSVICTVRKPEPGQPRLLLDAHIDEVGMMVTYVDESGFLRVGPCGGVDPRLLAASLVTVHSGEGPLPGVICSVPPHLSADKKKKNQKVEEVYVDVGLGGEEAKKRIFPGDVVTFRSRPRELLGDQVSGKALDDRAGCVAHLKALEYLGDAGLSCGLTAVFSSMEEVGGQGAKTAAYRTMPTHAIAVDVSFAHTPDAKKEECGEMGKGPMIGFAPILSKEMSEALIQTAKKEEIPYQVEVMGRRTGTNADSIAVTGEGVVTGLISLPQKYMHTPIEVVSVADVENTGKLIAAYIREKWGK